MANPSLFYCFRFVFRTFSLEFSRLSLFNYQGSVCRSRDSLFSLAHLFVLVKHFFQLFSKAFYLFVVVLTFFRRSCELQRLIFYQAFLYLSSAFFNFFKSLLKFALVFPSYFWRGLLSRLRTATDDIIPPSFLNVNTFLIFSSLPLRLIHQHGRCNRCI